MDKIVVLGIDGGSWNLLDPWIEEGELPNLEKIVKNGASGHLESTLPYVTCPAWRCYATGKNPGKLGVYYWATFDQQKGEINYVNADDFEGKTLWELFDEEGLSSGVINMPTTYPPDEIDGFMIAGTMADEEEDYTRPPSLKEELKADGYRINPSTDKGSQQWINEIQDIITKRFDVAIERLKDVDFMHITVFYTDKAQHNFWNGEETLKVWKTVDEELGRLLEQDVNILIMSDHGFQKLDRFFHINTWLEEQGYLARNEDIGDAAQKVGINRDMLFNFVKKLGIADLARKIVPRSVRRKIPRESGVVEETDMQQKINWDETQAFALSEGPLYILDGNVKNPERFKNRIKEEIESYKNGKIIKEVLDGDKIYNGPYSEEAPDLFLDQSAGIEIRMDLSDEVLSENMAGSTWIANHRRNGIFVAHGPDFQAGEKDISIYDLAPTILHHYNIAIPADIDGQVIKEIYKNGSEPEQRDVKKTNHYLSNIDI